VNGMGPGSSVDSKAHGMTDVGVVEPDASIDRLRKVQSVTEAALAYLTTDEALDELLGRVRNALGADTAAILLLDKARAELVARAGKGLEEEVRQGVRIPVGRGFAGTIAATGQPVIVDDVDHSMVLNPILRQIGVRSLLGVPLVVQGETLGVLHVGTLTPRRFTAEDTELLQLVGDRVALTVHAGLYERERQVARTLQRSLLPERLPTLPGIRLATRYQPASGGEVGGDWYDAFLLPNGSLAIAIGDVVGRGLGAASAMGRLRNALRAYAMDLTSPGDVLTRMDRLLQQLEPGEMATVLYGVIDPGQLTFRFACAAHLPPTLRDPDGSVRLVAVEPGPPLGAGVGGGFTEHQEQLHPGSAIVLCTDGLIERRGRSLDDGFRRLGEACAEDVEPEKRCDLIMERLLGDSEIDDDVALLVIEVATDNDNQWQTSLRADATQLVLLRRVLHRWLTGRGIEPNLVYDVLVGCGEAVANAIEHAYGPSGGVIRIGANRAPDALIVIVRDFGRWRSPRVAYRGRGILMMQELADSVEISPSDTGTTVELRWRLGDTA
jgi:anti-sigma regulatory factor (Ser/Thr protein kinase)/putative methionine-R-sulfoxide reductase with GAF domain